MLEYAKMMSLNRASSSALNSLLIVRERQYSTTANFTCKACRPLITCLRTQTANKTKFGNAGVDTWNAGSGTMRDPFDRDRNTVRLPKIHSTQTFGINIILRQMSINSIRNLLTIPPRECVIS